MKLLKESKTLSEKGEKALKESIWRTDPDTENIKHLTDEQINKLYDEITIEQDERISDAYVKDEILHVIIEDSEGITTDYMPDFEKDQLDRVMGKDMTESLNEDVNTNDLAKFIEKAVNDLKNGGEGVWYKRLGYTINDTELYLAIGLVSAKQFDLEDLKSYATDDTNEYVICGKIAINDSAMQSDYELDWIMPYYKSGDVWDTDSPFDANPDYTQEAKEFINEFNIMKNFNIADNGVVTEDDKSVEENLNEEISSDAYEVAEYIDNKLNGKSLVTWEEFNGAFDEATRNLGVNRDVYQDVDFESDVRAVLSNKGWETIFEGENEGGLKALGENLKEDLSNNEIRQAVFQVHDVMDAEYTEVVVDLVDRALLQDGTLSTDDAVWTAIDEGLIYTKDEWAVIEHFTVPKDLNENTYDSAIESLFNDVYAVVNHIKNK